MADGSEEKASHVEEGVVFDDSSSDEGIVEGADIVSGGGGGGGFGGGVEEEGVGEGEVEEVEEDGEEALRAKEEGNALFRDGKLEEALEKYRMAERLAPKEEEEFVKHRSVFFANQGAVLLRLKRYEECIVACDAALDLDEGYLKASLRRASALMGLEKFGDAAEDYEDILKTHPTCHEAKKGVERARRAEAEAAERMKEEMMGKLKEVGDGVLGWFGLSTDNFKMEQDPKTGGYSINFQQGTPPSDQDGPIPEGAGRRAEEREEDGGDGHVAT